MKRTHVACLAGLAASLTLAGCFEASKPLAPSGSVLHDPAVLGKWNCIPDPPLRPQDKATLTVRNIDPYIYDATWVDGDKTQRFRGHASKIDSTVIVNVLEVTPGAKWFFLRYKRDGAKLLLSTADAQAIKGGYEARKMDDLKARATGDELFKVFAACTKSR